MSSIDLLPYEILQHVFLNLSPQYLCNACTRVSRAWCEVIQLPNTWKKPLLAKNGVDYSKACNMIETSLVTWISLGRALIEPTESFLLNYLQIDALLYNDIRSCKEFTFTQKSENYKGPFTIEQIRACTIKGYVKLICHNTKFVRCEDVSNLCLKTVKYDLSSEFLAIAAGDLFSEGFGPQLIKELMSTYKQKPKSIDAHRIIQFLAYVLSHVPLCDDIVKSQNFAPEFESSLAVLSPEHYKILTEAFSDRCKRALENKLPLSTFCFHGFRYSTVSQAKLLKRKKNVKQTDILWGIPEREIAIELTLMSHELMRESSCIDAAYNTNPSMQKLINKFNLHHGLVPQSVLSGESAKIRASRISYFIRLAEQLLSLGNTLDATAIISGIKTTPVFRLKVSWAKISKSTMKVYDSVSEQLSSNSSFVKLRRFCLDHSITGLPQVPYIGFYMTDFTFIRDGNSSQKPFFNLHKNSMLVKIVGRFNSNLKPCYGFKSIPWIKSFITGWEVTMDDNDLYNLSLKAEPRKKN